MRDSLTPTEMKFNQSPRTLGGKFTEKMYLGKRKIMRKDAYEEKRAKIIERKDGAVWIAFAELEDLFNPSSLAMQYFKESGEWLTKRLDGCAVRDKETSLDENECGQLAEAFRDIAKRLLAHADEIDAAEMDE